MPQATDELREKMRGYYGDPIDDGGPIRFLLKAGYSINRGGVIIPPHPYYECTPQEGDSIDFLCDEWDYGYDPGEQP